MKQTDRNRSIKQFLLRHGKLVKASKNYDSSYYNVQGISIRFSTHLSKSMFKTDISIVSLDSHYIISSAIGASNVPEDKVLMFLKSYITLYKPLRRTYVALSVANSNMNKQLRKKK